ncbi:MAG: tetratricopeptide repeat protein [Prochlorothrix sp.]
MVTPSPASTAPSSDAAPGTQPLRLTPALALGCLLSASLSFNTPVLAQSLTVEEGGAPMVLLLAQASPLSQGWDLYNAQQYPEAIAQFQAAIAADPTNPKPHWGLTLCYNKLQQYAEAQAALKQAVALDPAIGFTSAESYNSLRTTIEKKLAPSAAQATTPSASPAAAQPPSSTAASPTAANPAAANPAAANPAAANPTTANPGTANPTTANPGTASPTAPAPSNQTERQELIAALAQGSTYVAPAMAATVNLADLDRAALALQPFTVKFVVVPTVTGDRQTYAQEIFEYLNLENGVVIVNTERGVDLYSPALTPEAATALVKANLATFTASDYTSGLVQLARSAQEAIGAATPAETPSQRGLWIALGVMVALGSVTTVINCRRKGQQKQQMQTKLEELQDLHYRVSEQLEDVKNYQKVVPETANTIEVRRSIDQATEQFLQASELLEQSPKTTQQCQALETHLQSATASLNQARAALDRATGQAPTDPSPETHGTCFFCSRPLALNLLQPRILDLKPQSKRVLCCPPCATQVDQNTPPKVKTVKEGDRDRPWYRSTSYNPYRDYYRYDRNWHHRSAFELELEFGDDDNDGVMQQVIIFADQAQYRDYQVQQVEQGQQLWAEPGSTGAPPEDSLEASGDVGTETPAATDFFWTDAEPEPNTPEIPEVADFFNQDPS